MYSMFTFDIPRLRSKYCSCAAAGLFAIILRFSACACSRPKGKRNGQRKTWYCKVIAALYSRKKTMYSR